MDKQDQDLAEERDKEVQEDNSQNNDVKLEELKRPNQRLLRLAKLNQGSTQDDDESKSPKINKNKTNKVTTAKREIILDIPPPTYESVVKFNPELNSTQTLPSSSQLPSYADVGGLSDAPPSYHSIFTETVLRVIHPFDSNEAVNRDTQQAKFSAILLNILLFIFMTSFVFLLPVSMIAMGIIYVHKCPVQPRLPIYLIVLGFFQMLECCGRLAFKLFQNTNTRQNETWRDRYRRKDPLIYFVIVWFIIGSMWVYQTDPVCRDCDSKGKLTTNLTRLGSSSSVGLVNYTSTSFKIDTAFRLGTCDKTIYAFAFWIVTSYYSVIAFFFLLVLFDVITRVFTRFCCPGRQQRRQARARRCGNPH